MITLSLEDIARLRPLLESAIVEAQTALSDEDGGFKPDAPEDLFDSLEWGEGLLQRINEAV